MDHPRGARRDYGQLLLGMIAPMTAINDHAGLCSVQSTAESSYRPSGPSLPDDYRPPDPTACSTYRYQVDEAMKALDVPIGMVARSVTKAEVSRTPAADAAVLAEWQKLRAVGDTGCWDESKVEECAVVKRRFGYDLDQLHLGALHELCFEKGSELAPGSPGRKFKGRVVFLGDRVRDGWGQAAAFEELSSSPASM